MGVVGGLALALALAFGLWRWQQVRAHEADEAAAAGLRARQQYALQIYSNEVGSRWVAEKLGHPSYLRRYTHVIFPGAYRGSPKRGDDFAIVHRFRQLEYLDISYERPSQEELGLLRGLTTLKFLGLTSVPVGPRGLDVLDLPSMTDLETLRLARAEIDDESLRALKGLRNLKELDLSNNRSVGNQGVLVLYDLKKLEVLDLSGTAITVEGLSVLESMPRLRQLNLNGNRDLDDDAGERLAKLGSIRELQLAGTRVGNRTVAALSKLPLLKTLDLSHTSITGECFKDFKRFPALELLRTNTDGGG